MDDSEFEEIKKEEIFDIKIFEYLEKNPMIKMKSNYVLRGTFYYNKMDDNIYYTCFPNLFFTNISTGSIMSKGLRKLNFENEKEVVSSCCVI